MSHSTKFHPFLTGASSQPTQYGHDLVVLDDLQWARHHEAKAVDALARVEDEVSRRTVHRLELHGQRPQTAIAGQPEGRVFLEHFPIEVHADVGSHVLGADLQHLAGQRRSPIGYWWFMMVLI